MSKGQRFEKIYTQGAMTTTEIWVDKETGVNYLFHACGTGPDGAPAEVRILGGGVYEIEGPTAETVAIIRERRCLY
mgnify:CR=1 FL=1